MIIIWHIVHPLKFNVGRNATLLCYWGIKFVYEMDTELDSAGVCGSGSSRNRKRSMYQTGGRHWPYTGTVATLWSLDLGQAGTGLGTAGHPATNVATLHPQQRLIL